MGISSAFIFRRKNQTLRADAKFVGREIRGCTLGARKRNVYTAALCPRLFFRGWNAIPQGERRRFPNNVTITRSIKRLQAPRHLERGFSFIMLDPPPWFLTHLNGSKSPL